MDTIKNLTAVVLAHQVSPQLDACLSSLKPAQHIIIVWNGYSDEAKNINLPKQAVLENHPDQITDFATVRNTALSLITTEWCLMLDSDEVVSETTWQVWQKELTTTADAFSVQRFDHFLGKKLKWGEVKNQWHTRLFRVKKTQFTRPIHETAVVQGTIVKSKGVIEHYPHPTITEFFSDVTAYAKKDAELRFHQKEKWSLLQTLTHPLGKFFYNLVLLQGWRDGFPGMVYTFMMAFHSLWVRVNLYELTKSNSR